MIAPQHRVYAAFYLFALTIGGLLSRFADLQVELGLSEGPFGMVVIGWSVGMLFAMTFCTPIIEWLGVKRTVIITITVSALCQLLAAASGMPVAVFGIMVFGGVMVGMLEIVLNVEADRTEAAIGRRIMNRAHSFWSLGFFSSAVIGGLMRQFEVSMVIHLALMLPVLAGGAFIAMRGFTPAPRRHPKGSKQKTPVFAIPTPGILALCAVALSASLVEGAGFDWSVIYMRDVFESEPFVSSMSLIAISASIWLARVGADSVVDRFGARQVTYFLLCIATAGLLLVGFAPTPELAILGFALMGVGASAIYPLVVSEAAGRTDRPAEINVAALGQTAFLVFFLGPPLLGFVAEHFGNRASFLVILPMVLLSFVFTHRMSTRPAAKPAEA
ncbi:MFS transporter [Cucumibacter marinus]|uniref:MFS transporter n=1 Tax=Cucumibacter marinus TaxID=1121252 RepID=UPI0003FE94BB|nr:MFS transporter [Cucumibacter marinus]